jgi:hypothetical protein
MISQVQWQDGKLDHCRVVAMSPEFQDVENDVQRLLRNAIPEFDPTKIEHIADPTPADFAGIDGITLVGSVRGVCVLALKATRYAIRVIEVPNGKYGTIALIAAAFGISLPSLPDLIVEQRRTSIEAVAEFWSGQSIEAHGFVQKVVPVGHCVSVGCSRSGPTNDQAAPMAWPMPIPDPPRPAVPVTSPSSYILVASTTNTSLTTTTPPPTS